MKKMWLAVALLLMLTAWSSASAAYGDKYIELGSLYNEFSAEGRKCSGCSDSWCTWQPSDTGGTCVLICNNCGGWKDQQEHFTYCTEDHTVCYACGTSGLQGSGAFDGYNPVYSQIVIIHTDEHLEELGGEYTVQDHRFYCNACGVSDTHPYYLSCDRPFGCLTCNRLVEYTPSGDELEHVTEYVNLGDTHINGCEYCGYRPEWAWEDRHWACCEAGLICGLCGATMEKYDYYEYGSDDEWIDLGDQHQLHCLTCGTMYEPEDHRAVCTDPDVCVDCGASVSFEADQLEHWSTEWENLGDTHRLVCYDCGCVVDEGEHYARCTEPEVCDACGAFVNFEEDQLVHWYSEWEDHGDTHREVCSDCGYVFSEGPHEAICTSKTVCYYCEYTIPAVDDDHTLHYTSKCKWRTTYTTCQEYCTDCGYEWEEGEHVAYCTSPDVCLYCGESDVLTELFHDMASRVNITWTTAVHNYDCGICGDHLQYPHTLVDGECWCGYVEGEVPSIIILPGDADNSKGVTLADALAILEYITDEENGINAENADVNDDGKVDIYDALIILQYIAGWNVTLK